MPKNQITRKLASVEDNDGTLRRDALRIAKKCGADSYAAGIRIAVSFMTSAQKQVSKPIDYTDAPLELLRDYCVHGYDFTVRAPALAEIERRYKSAQEQAE